MKPKNLLAGFLSAVMVFSTAATSLTVNAVPEENILLNMDFNGVTDPVTEVKDVNDRITANATGVTVAKGQDGKDGALTFGTDPADCGKEGVTWAAADYDPFKGTNGNITFSIWAKPTAMPDGTALFYYGTDSGSQSSLYIQAKVKNKKGIYVTYRKGSTTGKAAVDMAWTLNEWHLITFVEENGVAKLYVNGQNAKITWEKVQNNTVGGVSGDNQANIYCLGYVPVTDWTDNPRFQGDMDNFTIYNRALTANEIHDLYYGEDFKLEVVSATNPDVSVAYNTQADALNLPGTVNVTLNDGSTLPINVAWNTASYNPTLVGTVQNIPGALTLPENITNPGNVTVSAAVTVRAEMLEFEAEDALLGGTAAIFDQINDLGSQTVAGFDNGKGSATFTVYAAEAGKRTMEVWYLGGSGRSFQVAVNGVHQTAVTCPNTGDWNTKVFLTEAAVTLEQGFNTIKFDVNASEFGPKLDKIAIEKKAGDPADQKAAVVDAVKAMIDAIGEVTYPASGDAIVAAETAYAALPDAQKANVTNSQTLTDARTEYDRQQEAAPKTVVSVENPADITVLYNTAANELNLPEAVNVTLSNESDVTMDVIWDTASYDPTNTEPQTIPGALVLPENVTNPDNITVSIVVTVLPAISEDEILLDMDFAGVTDPVTEVKDVNDRITANATGVTVAKGQDGKDGALTFGTDPTDCKKEGVTWAAADYDPFKGTNGNVTFSIWAKPTAMPDNTVLFYYGTTSDTQSSLYIQARAKNEKGIYVTYRNGSANPVLGKAAADMAWTLNEWHLITFVEENGVAKLYVNGQNVKLNWVGNRPQNNTVGGVAEASTENVYCLGYVNVTAWKDNPRFQGDMDNFTIYNRALTADEIMAIYTDEKVLPKTVTSVENPAGMEVAYNTPADALNLPATVQVTLSDDTAVAMDVAWDTASYDPVKAEAQTITGTITLPEGVTNPDDITAAIVVTVKPEEKEVAGDITGDGTADLAMSMNHGVLNNTDWSISWNGSIDIAEDILAEDLNNITVTSYGMYYGASKADIESLITAGDSSAKAKKVDLIVKQGVSVEDAVIYTNYGIKFTGLKDTFETRAAQMYLTYTLDGKEYTIYGNVIDVVQNTAN